jgi:hypothetical protein
MGARFRLQAGYDISGYGPEARVVLTAMKHFGLIVADNGSNWFFQGTKDLGCTVPRRRSGGAVVPATRCTSGTCSTTATQVPPQALPSARTATRS